MTPPSRSLAASLLALALAGGVATGGFVACDGESTPVPDPAGGGPVPANVGTPLSLSLHQRGPYPDLGLELVPIALNESRCPTGVTCVWAGDCAVTVLARVEGAVDTLVLHTHDTMDQSLPTHGGTTISLLDVSPYPAAGKSVSQADYIISIDATPPGDS